VNNAAVTLTLNGGSVAPVVTGPDANGLLSISYNPNGLVAGSSNTYVLSVPDTGVPAPVVTRTRTATFTVAAPPQPAATNITWSVTGGNQTVMEWPNGQGWRLEVQTNGLGIGLSTNWVTVPGAVSPYTNTVTPADPAVFYRLVFP
jgi:hypothetical protein